MRKGSSGSSKNASERRVVRGVACVGLLVAIPARAAAQEAAAAAQQSDAPQQADAKTACLSSYENSQVLRQQGRLLEAREALGVCSREECPALVRADCGTWLEEVDKAIPSVIVQATADGAEISDVTVSIDGKVAKSQLDGKALSTDPGSHVFRFEAGGFAPIETTVVVREGEHYRPLTAEFQSPRHPTEPVRVTRPVPRAVWVLGGVAIAGAAGFATFGILGNQKKQRLLDSGCAPFCTPSEVDVAQRDYAAADVSLGVGVAALAAGSILYLARPEVPVRIGIAPLPSATLLNVSGHF